MRARAGKQLSWFPGVYKQEIIRYSAFYIDFAAQHMIEFGILDEGICAWFAQDILAFRALQHEGVLFALGAGSDLLEYDLTADLHCNLSRKQLAHKYYTFI